MDREEATYGLRGGVVKVGIVPPTKAEREDATYGLRTGVVRVEVEVPTKGELEGRRGGDTPLGSEDPPGPLGPGYVEESPTARPDEEGESPGGRPPNGRTPELDEGTPAPEPGGERYADINAVPSNAAAVGDGAVILARISKPEFRR